MMTSPAFYRAFGLDILSACDIPGAVAIDPVGAPDITIALARAGLDEVEATNGPYSRAGDTLLFDAPGIGRYLAPSPDRLLIEPYPDADPDHVSALLIATALPMLLWMRGGLVLHAAGVVLPGAPSAIAIAGSSGAGKSRLAQGLVTAGAKLVGDDAIWIDRAGGGVTASGLPGISFMPIGTQEPRQSLAIPPHSRAGTELLAAVVILTHGSCDQAAPAMLRLSHAEALEALLKHRHRPRIPALLKREGAVFQLCVLLSRDLPIYRLDTARADFREAQERVATALLDRP